MVNSTNIFWYLLGKMSTHNIQTIDKSEKTQIKSLTDFLVQLETMINSEIQLGQTAASGIAISLFRESVDEKSSDPLERQKLDDIRRKIVHLKGIQRQVLNFLEKLSNSKELSTDDLKFSRILSLYISLCYKSSDDIEQITDHLKKIQNISDELRKLIVLTTVCNQNATCFYNVMDIQLRTVERAYILFHPNRTHRYPRGREQLIQARLREQTREEIEEASREQAKSDDAIKSITSEVEKRLKRLQDMTDELNELSKLFSEISEQFKSLAENPSFFDFMMRLFQGQICETTFSEVSINFQNFCSSLQTTIANMFPYFDEINDFKNQKEAENALRQQDTKHFLDRKQANIDEWKKRDDELKKKEDEMRIRQQNLEAKKQPRPSNLGFDSD
jgi:hypothetical protein